jgi:hypothetical protein
MMQAMGFVFVLLIVLCVMLFLRVAAVSEENHVLREQIRLLQQQIDQYERERNVQLGGGGTSGLLVMLLIVMLIAVGWALLSQSS